MQKYLNKNELVINFKINQLIRMQKIARLIGGSPNKYESEIKALENSLRRD